MSGLILDTNAYVAFKRGMDGAVEVLSLAEEIVVPAVVLGELLAGFACGDREAENRREFTEFLDLARVRVAVVDSTTASWYGRVYSRLRRSGRPIPANDLWIAASALQNGLPVFSYDRHFDHVEGLAIVARPEDLLP
ncbi:MAG: type II toxin-antitoxin system VapC family toxin [Thermoanaerobaculales bacterium]|nr:type II toxin-antitoxin system VapC family toxin [Thermoanaerobaculales bacterium]